MNSLHASIALCTATTPLSTTPMAPLLLVPTAKMPASRLVLDGEMDPRDIAPHLTTDDEPIEE